MKIYVGNLTPTMSELELKKLFFNHGIIVEYVQIITDHFTRQSKCFGYVKMKCEDDVTKALNIFHGKMVNKLLLVAKKARSRDERQGRPW
ncbi:MAG: RNA-binding protein [Pseudomonadota bacterium]